MFPTFKIVWERWKYNPAFELYVSNMGHFRNKSKADIAPKILQGGYCAVFVHGSLNRYMLAHRVVMLTWRPTPEAEKLTVDHLDHNKRNNALSNLEWVSQEENSRRAEKDYLPYTEVVGNEIACTTKVAKKVKAAIANPNMITGKRKTDPTDIAYFHIRYSNNQKPVDFIIYADLSDFDVKTAPFVGKVNNFTRDGLRGVLNNMLNGKNCNAIKEWCKFKVKAVYTDGAYKDGVICNLKIS